MKTQEEILAAKADFIKRWSAWWAIADVKKGGAFTQAFTNELDKLLEMARDVEDEQ